MPGQALEVLIRKAFEKASESGDRIDAALRSVPDLANLIETLDSDPSINQGSAPHQLGEQALGLNEFDPTNQIDPVTAPTTPQTPAAPCVVGFFDQIGVAWSIRRWVENVVGYQIQRSQIGDFTDAVDLGTHRGQMYIDKNLPKAPFGPSVTRTYRIRTVALVGGTPFFSAYTAGVAATTLASGSTNADLQTRIDTFVGCLQAAHITTVTTTIIPASEEALAFAFFMGT